MPSESAEPLPFWRRPVAYRSAIGLYVFLVLALGAFAVSVNVVQVEGAAYLRGHSDFEKGRTVGLRGVFQYSPTGELLVPETFETRLIPTGDDGNHEGHELELISRNLDRTWPDVTFRVPDDLPDGEYEFRIHATHDRVSSLTGSTTVSVSERPDPAKTLHQLPWPQLRPRCDEDKCTRNEVRQISQCDVGPDIALEVIPSEGELIRSQKQRVFLRIFERGTGRPVRSYVELRLVDGMAGEMELDTASWTVTSDRFGFASVDITAVTDLRLEAKIAAVPTDHAEDGSLVPEADLHRKFPLVKDCSPGFNEIAEEQEDLDQRHGDSDFDALLSDENSEDLLDQDEELKDSPPQNLFEIALPAISAQFTIEPARSIVTEGHDIEANIRSILRERTYMVDLYDFEDNRLLDTLSLNLRDGAGGAKFTTPSTDEASRLLRLQTYQSFYGVTHGWDSKYVLLVSDYDIETYREGLQDLWSWLALHRDDPHYSFLATQGEELEGLSRNAVLRLANAALADIPNTLEEPQVLINTRQADVAALAEWREEMRGLVMVMMSILLLLGLAVVLYFIAIGIRRQQREAIEIRAIELEFEDPDPTAQRRAELIERFVVALQATIVFGMLLAFAVGIVVVVSIL